MHLGAADKDLKTWRSHDDVPPAGGPRGTEDPGERSCDWPARVRDSPKWWEIREVTDAICLSSQMHDNSLNYPHNFCDFITNLKAGTC